MDKQRDTDPNGLEGILFNIIQEKLAGQEHPEGILEVLREMMAFAQDLIQGIEDSGQAPLVSCRSGCSYCCHSQVNILPIEALLISEYLGTNFSSNSIEGVEANITANLNLTRGKNIDQRFALKGLTPCIFLDNHRCGIYPVRPMICRAWNSLDRDACQSAYDNGDVDTEIDTSPMRNFVFSTTRDLFGKFSSQMTLQAGTSDIPRAIRDCLSVTDPLALWLRGGLLFKS